jgi:hypothetical protein
VLATIPEVLATGQVEVIDIANTEFEQPVRMEARRNKKGELRGIAWRERNKDRKAVWYVGKNSTGQRKQQWDELRPVFESANTIANAILEG